MTEDGSKGTWRTCLRVNWLPELPAGLDLMVWWKSAQQQDTFRAWGKGSLSSCGWLVTVGYFRMLATSSGVWGFSLSHRGVSTQLSVFVNITWVPELFPVGRGRDISSFSEKAQKALVSCLFPFVLLPKSPACTLATSCSPFMVEALTLKVPLPLHCCHLAWDPSALTANTSPHRL